MGDNWSTGQRQAIEDLRNIEADCAGRIIINEVGLSKIFAGFLEIGLLVDCKKFKKRSGGATIDDTEEVFLLLQSGFPFDVPICFIKHERFAGHSHVSYKYFPCLYLAPDSQYEPSNGIRGYIARLLKWIEDAAANNLDPIGAPLHPPAVYTSNNDFLLIPTVDTPHIENDDWIGHAKCIMTPISSKQNPASKKLEIVEWIARDQKLDPGFVYAYALLFKKFMPYEYPRSIGTLIEELSPNGVNKIELFLSMLNAANINEANLGLIIIGSPMRGVAGGKRIQHLSAWLINPDDVKELKTFAQTIKNKPFLDYGSTVSEAATTLKEKAKISWCQVMEDRPEVVMRRDGETPMMAFRDKSVLLIGCGAIGSYVAEHFARAGVKKLILVDNKKVTPGLLSRQNYLYGDIGKFKSEALANRLDAISHKVDVSIFTDDLKNIEDKIVALGNDKEIDYIIDATASKTVLLYIEYLIQRGSFPKLSTFSLAFGSNAQSALVLYRKNDYSGGLYDVSRKALLSLSVNERGRYYKRQFWPDADAYGKSLFQPEPGCSEPTFQGSGADVSSLAAAMTNVMAREILRATAASATFFVQPHMFSEKQGRYPIRYEFKNDIVIRTAGDPYEIRIDENEYAFMLRLGNDVRIRKGQSYETGGVLYGQIDEAARVVWVSKVTPPPPDSEERPNEFISGIDGVQEESCRLEGESLGNMRFIGFWHTHPGSTPSPSIKDAATVSKYLIDSKMPTYKTILVIVNPDSGQNSLGAYVGKMKKREDGKCAIVLAGDMVDGIA